MKYSIYRKLLQHTSLDAHVWCLIRAVAEPKPIGSRRVLKICQRCSTLSSKKCHRMSIVVQVHVQCWLKSVQQPGTRLFGTWTLTRSGLTTVVAVRITPTIEQLGSIKKYYMPAQLTHFLQRHKHFGLLGNFFNEYWAKKNQLPVFGCEWWNENLASTTSAIVGTFGSITREVEMKHSR